MEGKNEGEDASPQVEHWAKPVQHVANGVAIEDEDEDEHDGEGVSIIGETMPDVRRIKASRGSGILSGNSTVIPCGIRSWQQAESIPSRITESTMHCNTS